MTLFGAFNITAVLVALNMLIAILNDSYVQITVKLYSKKIGYFIGVVHARNFCRFKQVPVLHL